MRMLNLANNMQVQGGGGLVRLPLADFQTLAALYDGSLPASQSYSRLSNAWNSETGLVAPHNAITQSELTDGLTGTTIVGGSILSTLAGYDAAVANPGGAITNNITKAYTFFTGEVVITSVDVQMDDLSEPRFGTSISDVNLDIVSYFASGTVISTVLPPVSLGNNVWRLYAYGTMVASATSGFGVTNRTGNSRKPFKITAFNVSRWDGVTYTPPYIKTTTAAVYMPRYQTGRQGQAILIEGASTNKCTAWSVPRPDSVGADLITVAADRDFSSDTTFWTRSGTTAIGGGVCNINGATNQGISRNSFTTIGQQYRLTFDVVTVRSGTLKAYAGTGSTFFTVPAGTGTKTLYFTAGSTSFAVYGVGTVDIDIDNISLVPVTDAVDTTSYYDTISVAFQQNVPNMTLSGDTAAVLQVYSDSVPVDAVLALSPTDGSMVALKASQANGYKFYRVTTGAGGAGTVSFSGAMTAVATSMGLVTRVVAGSATIGDSAAANTLALSGSTFYNAKKEGFTATAARTMYLTLAANSTVDFLLPTVEESAYLTSPILCQGVATTRAAGAVSGTSAGVIANNMFLQSNAFTTTWSATGTPSAIQNAVDPFGDANSAWTLTDNAATTEFIQQSVVVPVQDYVFSVFVKKTVGAQASYPLLAAGAVSNIALCTIDTSNGIATAWTAYTALTVVPSSASVQDYSDDFWRVSLRLTTTAAAWAWQVIPAGTTNPTQATGVSDTTAQGSVVVYGAQLNTGTTATPYLPTTTTAAYQGSINIWFKPTAVATGKTQTLWSSYTDASNWTSLYSNGVIFYIEKRKAGISEYVTVPIAAVGGSWYLCSIIFNADGTMGLMVNGTADGKTSGAFPTGLGASVLPAMDLNNAAWTKANVTPLSADSYQVTAANGQVWAASSHTAYKLYKDDIALSLAGSTHRLRLLGAGTYYTAGVNSVVYVADSTSGLASSMPTISGIASNIIWSSAEVHNSTTASAPVIAATYKVGAFADTATGTLQCDGLIDNERYFGRVLTLAEHQVYYARGK